MEFYGGTLPFVVQRCLLLKMTFLRVLVFMFSILVAEPYEFKLQTSIIGNEFRPSDPNNLISSESNVRSLTKCAIMCSVNEVCQTIDFDHVSMRCRLFAAWIYEGTTVSASLTSKTAFIAPDLSFYFLYNQSCMVSSEYSRFLACENGRWACQSSYYWNGSACERKRSSDQPCQANDWCDSNRFLLCLNVTNRCACNHSMTWNVSQCSPSMSLRVLLVIRIRDVPLFSLSSWANGYHL